MVSHLSPVSAAYDIGKRILFSRRHPEVASEVENLLFQQVISEYVTCLGKGAEKCEHIRSNIDLERGKPRRTGMAIADTNFENTNSLKGELNQLNLELRTYRHAAACAYIAGGKPRDSQAALEKIGFLFDHDGNISAPADWKLDDIPQDVFTAIRGVPFRAKQVARSTLWSMLTKSEGPSAKALGLGTASA